MTELIPVMHLFDEEADQEQQSADSAPFFAATLSYVAVYDA